MNEDATPRSLARVILLVLALTMLAFGSSIVYSQRTAAHLDDNAKSIATNASPAIKSLVAARRELFRIELVASALERRAPLPDGELEAALSRFRAEMAAYRSLSFYAGEVEPYGDVERTIRALDAELAKGAGRGEVIAAAADADQALERLINFNAEQQYRLSMEIPVLRQRAARFGYVLQGLAIASALLLTMLVIRATQGYAAAAGREKVLAEERARDLESFGAKLRSIIESTTKIGAGVASNEGLEATFRTVAAEARAIVDADHCAVGFGSDPEPPSHFPAGPFLAVPIVHAADPVGNLYLAREPSRPAFTEHDERAARLLALYAGVAVHNARLYGDACAATRAREDLLAVVSHDLKNPLNVILMSCDLLRSPASSGKAAELTARIDRAARRMARLIADLLDSAKIEAGLFETTKRPEEVASLVGEAVDTFTVAASEKGVRLSARVERQPPRVLCEKDLVLRVFSNLIGNAMKFSPKGGTIEVAAEPAGPEEIDFSVRDDGPGIASDYLPHLFERYSQQKSGDRRGSGLGLYIAKGIVEAHGGRIWADSSLGSGTTVHFTLPAQ